jgi:alpha-methylacyl-CoA racemase
MGQDKSRPHFPANLVGDFGGGSTYLVIGVLAALLEARISGEGQVVDAAIVDGTSHLSAMFAGMLAGGSLKEERRSNLLDGGMPFYDVYETSDGRHMSVGSLEPQFYDELVKLLDIPDAPDRYDFERTEELRRVIAERFATRTQAEWTEVFEGTDACVAPIIPLTEAMEHPHMAAREVYVEHDGIRQPAPAPRFSRTTTSLGLPPRPKPGADTRDALTAWGIEDVDALIEKGVAVQA